MRNEQTLRDAFALLDEHAPTRLDGITEVGGFRGPSRRRILAPALAAAAVVVVGGGAVVLGPAGHPRHSSQAAGDPSVVAHPSWSCPSGASPRISYTVSLDAQGKDRVLDDSELCPDGTIAGAPISMDQALTATVAVWSAGAYTPPAGGADRTRVTIDGIPGYYDMQPAESYYDTQPAKKHIRVSCSADGTPTPCASPSSVAVYASSGGMALLFWEYAPNAYVSVSSHPGVRPGGATQPLPTAAQLVAIAEGLSWRGKTATVPLTLSQAPGGLALASVVSSTAEPGVTLGFVPTGSCATVCYPVVTIRATRSATNVTLGNWGHGEPVVVDGSDARYEPPGFDTSAAVEIHSAGWDVLVSGQAKRPGPSEPGMGTYPELSLSKQALVAIASSITMASVSDPSTWRTVGSAIPRP